jgi:hypothetical protein
MIVLNGNAAECYIVQVCSSAMLMINLQLKPN